MKKVIDGIKFEPELGSEALKIVASAGQAGLKSALIINGGASIAIISVIGAIFKTDGPNTTVVLLGLGESLQWFAWGTLLAAVASGLTYISEALAFTPWFRLSLGLNVFLIALVIVSYFSFYKGADLARIAITLTGTPI